MGKFGAGEANRTPDPNLGKVLVCLSGDIRDYPALPRMLDIYDFSENEAPSYEEVEINYRGFIEALIRHGKKLSDVINDAGYIPRKFSNLGVITHSLMNLLLSYCIAAKIFV